MVKKLLQNQGFKVLFALGLSALLYYLGWKGGYDHGFVSGYAEISSTVSLDTVDSQRRQIDEIASGVRRVINCEDGPESIIQGVFLSTVEGMKAEIQDLRNGNMELALERDLLRKKLSQIKGGK